MNLVAALLLILCLTNISIGQSASSNLIPRRSVDGQTLISGADPAVTLTFREPFRYVGGQRFILYNLADAEQHVFVDTDDNARIRRMFWVQFEHFLPSNSETYRYKREKTAKLGSFEFITDVRPFGSAEEPDSDGGHIKTMLESKGLHWPTDAVRARLIHLPNPDRRSELMIIYGEDGRYAQIPASELTSYQSSQHWPQIEKTILKHVQRLLTAEEVGEIRIVGTLPN